MMKNYEQAEFALTGGEQEPPSWQEIAEEQQELILNLQRINSELHFALARLIDAKIWWRCPASWLEH